MADDEERSARSSRDIETENLRACNGSCNGSIPFDLIRLNEVGCSVSGQIMIIHGPFWLFSVYTRR